ncbi:polysaccharide deacetylase family protein [Candidatus Woesearchaeota archaeon]|nr:polysaccharide deacetylase family protein [Candidatus Woesearchaeota archaeon]
MKKRGDNVKKKLLLVLLLGLLCFGAIAVEAKKPTTTTTTSTSTTTTTTIKQIPWLGFHDVVADVHEATSDINVAFLNEWTQFLADKGYKTLTYDQMYSYLNGTNTTGLPDKVVVLSFDDNYIGVYDYAYPRLSALGLNATNFVHTNYVGVVTSKDHADWTELGEMETDGHIVAESHTKNHVDLTAVDPTTRWDEIAGSKAAIEGNLSKTCNYLAYPYGKTNAEVIADVSTAGYLSAVLYNNEYATVNDPEFEVARLQMGKTDNMAIFKQKILYKADIHVENIAMEAKRQGQNRYARATITIKDEDSALVEGATVHVEWSGLVEGTDSGNTNSEGVVVLDSPKTREQGNVTVTVTDVVKNGHYYDASANVETSDSVTI